MGAERELLEKIAVVQKKGIIGAEDLLIGHPLGTQRDRFKALPAAIEVIEGLVLKISDHPRQEEVIPCGRGVKPLLSLPTNRWHRACPTAASRF
jgi:hypothetical protein